VALEALSRQRQTKTPFTLKHKMDRIPHSDQLLPWAVAVVVALMR
jgi:hypothetical protein